MTSRTETMETVAMDENLHQQLDRWVAGGLLTADQAARIEAAEYRRSAERPAPSVPAERAVPTEPAGPSVPVASRSAYVVEALGYLGGGPVGPNAAATVSRARPADG